jgi:hypothetical protein
VSVLTGEVFRSQNVLTLQPPSKPLLLMMLIRRTTP